ncbi:MAG TPA: chemotaxis protein CheW [Alteromonas macleodii]|mgnify:CR=1 FL=1|jgi:purine-binding chemotaxis protein CheW|uniref:Chemotaxis protein CheW n=1 Tax=Alteromonas marina TaxID=203795 RepID=A0A0B3YV58_9ALTE|nr:MULTISPECIES: chemotaxis protein CheW [Alteromonas]KHT44449.1 chemotaxis protein CheW [Alteromonas marina]MAW04571.1 chemotaxis protein CheW [Alteromonas sp.]HCS81936.1 chemotaxis protein CheW [Alteromonas macleodii]|tara:strand:- start:6968 stop:7774 length:807 start_codon:yes stop_codon:yes gene_type:complete
MSKQSPFAREEVMEAYLDSLLKEPETPEDVTARTAKLLEQASQQMAESALVSTVEKSEPPTSEQEAIAEKVTSLIETQKVETVDGKQQQFYAETSAAQEQDEVLGRSPISKVPLKDTLGFRFQALFFEVAGLTLAVPLTSLGGIHQIEKIGPLFGKPDWFMGVMLHRESKLSVVDSAKWVMPEKYDENLAQSLNYRYLIMLGESAWGLASEKLVNTVNLTTDDVKWRESTGKRPWLAGMVKEKMCALIDVEELISMLNKGLGSNDQTP